MNCKRKCLVCGDKAFWFNFTGLSCESCRLFFIRNAFRHKNLYCSSNLRNCEINLETRNCCSRCRLDKCVSIGMKKELIKGKYSIKNMNTQTTEPSPEKVILLNENNIFTRYLQMNELEKLHEVQNALRIFCEETTLTMLVRQSTSLVDSYIMSDMYIRKIVKFCKSIRAYKSLQECDQLVIFKEFFCFHNTIRFAFGFNFQNDGYAMFLDENNQNGGQRIFIKMNIFRQWRRQNVESFFRRVLYSLQMEMENDPVVRNLFITHALFKPQEGGTCPELIRYHYHVYRHLLKCYFEHKYRDHSRASNRFSSLMQLLNDLSRVNELCKEIFADVNCDETNEVLKEIFW